MTQEEKVDERNSGLLTFKRILICLSILVPVAYGIVQYRTKVRESKQALCIPIFKNFGESLALYRADFDEKMPKVGPRMSAEIDDRLLKYAGGKAIDCPSGNSDAYQIRRTFKDEKRPWDAFYYGTAENSVMAMCSGHTSHGVGINPKISPYIYTAVSGQYNLLLRNGSVKSIPNNMPQVYWSVDKGKLEKIDYMAHVSKSPMMAAVTYEFEPPPEFEP